MGEYICTIHVHVPCTILLSVYVPTAQSLWLIRDILHRACSHWFCVVVVHVYLYDHNYVIISLFSTIHACVGLCIVCTLILRWFWDLWLCCCGPNTYWFVSWWTLHFDMQMYVSMYVYTILYSLTLLQLQLQSQIALVCHVLVAISL